MALRIKTRLYIGGYHYGILENNFWFCNQKLVCRYGPYLYGCLLRAIYQAIFQIDPRSPKEESQAVFIKLGYGC